MHMCGAYSPRSVTVSHGHPPTYYKPDSMFHNFVEKPYVRVCDNATRCHTASRIEFREFVRRAITTNHHDISTDQPMKKMITIFYKAVLNS